MFCVQREEAKDRREGTTSRGRNPIYTLFREGTRRKIIRETRSSRERGSAGDDQHRGVSVDREIRRKSVPSCHGCSIRKESSASDEDSMFSTSEENREKRWLFSTSEENREIGLQSSLLSAQTGSVNCNCLRVRQFFLSQTVFSVSDSKPAV